jgi:pyruvate dehydrogenase E1 component alpha subunit
MHIADFSIGMLGANGIVGGGLPIATGAALAAQLDGKGNVTVCFFGDGAVSEGEFHEALNISSVWALPIVFVCENNQYAANNAVEVQHRVPELAGHASAYGIPGASIDGNDVLAVYDAIRSAVDRARAGEGASLVECKTYRWYFHAEVAAWKARDPIARFASDLVERGLTTPAEIDRLKRQIEADLHTAVAFAEASPFPDPGDLLVDMYARN